MTKATPLELTSTGPVRPAATRSGRTSVFNSIWALFTMTLARQAKSRRLLLLSLLYLLPIVFAVLIRSQGIGFRGPESGYQPAFAELVLIFNLIPQALLPLTALVYASGMIQDEIEEQTITYLLIRPLPKWSIYVAKFLATVLVTIALMAVFTIACFLVIGWGQADYWSSGGTARMFKTIAIFSLTLTAYNAIFGLLSLLMRRAIILGIGYILLLEGYIGNIDFVIRKGTVVYYFRVMAERWIHLGQAENYSIDLATAPDLQQCVVILSVFSITAVAFAALLMNLREFRVKTPESS